LAFLGHLGCEKICGNTDGPDEKKYEAPELKAVRITDLGESWIDGLRRRLVHPASSKMSKEDDGSLLKE
jgi:hypothetical protein